ncbi:hypothetical protein Glove_476g61 [Diversispora epigaea]|uniref:Uncharacterized protein n=1 Tax=Diversispora epigaea TaxID=1348612 RepID=A0A397GU74_9GLOM|nr:hypothetical protein Glove_476g61 [Diversispora epigaea]
MISFKRLPTSSGEKKELDDFISVARLRFRSLSELTRQITPSTKNSHVPPMESKKSSQSVNPYFVWTW